MIKYKRKCCINSTRIKLSVHVNIKVTRKVNFVKLLILHSEIDQCD